MISPIDGQMEARSGADIVGTLLGIVDGYILDNQNPCCWIHLSLFMFLRRLS